MQKPYRSHLDLSSSTKYFMSVEPEKEKKNMSLQYGRLLWNVHKYKGKSVHNLTDAVSPLYGLHLLVSHPNSLLLSILDYHLSNQDNSSWAWCKTSKSTTYRHAQVIWLGMDKSTIICSQLMFQKNLNSIYGFLSVLHFPSQPPVFKLIEQCNAIF